jgi:hypothetical protein
VLFASERLVAAAVASMIETDNLVAAIYQRIEGNRFGHGGMIGKNVWVLLWWRVRRRLLEGGRR